MAKGGAGEAKGIAAISALVGKQHKRKGLGNLKKAIAKKATTKKESSNKEAPKKEETKKESPKASASSASKTKSGPKAKQQEFNFTPPKPKSETPRKRPPAKKASGSNPTHARNMDTGKLEKMSTEQRESVKSYDAKKESYAPPKLKPVKLD